MNYNMLVSIVVPVYNVAPYLEKCINSILKQTHQNIELILVDDGSTDESGEICDNYAKWDCRIKVIHQTNQGVSVARNVGLQNSKGYFVGFVDGDDCVHVDMYRLLVETIKSNDADLSMCGWKDVFPNKEISYHDDGSIELLSGEKNFRAVTLNRSFGGFVWNKLFINEIIKKNKLFFDAKISLLEDLFFVCNYAEYCKSFVTISCSMYYVLQRPGSAVNTIATLTTVQMMIQARMRIVDILERKGYKFLAIEESAYLCSSAMLEFCLEKENGNRSINKKLFEKTYLCLKKSVTATTISKLKAVLFSCNQHIYFFLWKTFKHKCK